MKHRFLLISSAVVALASAAGCSKKDTQDSSDVTTHGMSMDLSAYSDGTNTTVTSTLHSGDFNSNESVRLTSGDALVLHNGSSTLALNEHDDNTAGGVVVRYQSVLSGVSSGSFVVDFTRTSGESALGNTVVLPPAFNLTAPTGTVSRKNNITLNWDSTGNNYSVEVDLTGDCIYDLTKFVVGEPGNFTINASDVQVIAGHESDICPVTITVKRRIQSSANFAAAFGHTCGSDAQQNRTAVIQSGP
jgi:hypothetical protein